MHNYLYTVLKSVAYVRTENGEDAVLLNNTEIKRPDSSQRIDKTLKEDRPYKMPTLSPV